MGYPGATVVSGTLSLSASTDTYATHWDVLGKGGSHPAADIAARNAITTEKRSWGMFCTVYADGTPANNKTYQLQNLALGGADGVITNNSNWKEFISGGSSLVIQNAGTPLTVRSIVNISNGLSSSDNGGATKTEIQLGGPLVADTLINANYVLQLDTKGLLVGTGTLDTSAILELSSTSKGLLLSRIATEVSLTTPVDGLFYYSSDSTLRDIRARINGQWSSITRPEQLILGSGVTAVTLDESHRNKIIYTTAATTVTFTGNALDVGFTCTIIKSGTGDVVFAPGGGQTYEGIDNTISSQYIGATFFKKSSTIWAGVGGLGVAGTDLLTNGSGTAASGTSVNLGGLLTTGAIIDGDGNSYSVEFTDLDEFTVFSLNNIEFRSFANILLDGYSIELEAGAGGISISSTDVNNIYGGTFEATGVTLVTTLGYETSKFKTRHITVATTYSQLEINPADTTLSAQTVSNQSYLALTDTGFNYRVKVGSPYHDVVMDIDTMTFDGLSNTTNSDFNVRYTRFTGGNITHTNTGTNTFIWGDNNINKGSFGAAMFGELGEIETGSGAAFMSGERNYIAAYGAMAQGRGVKVSGTYSWGGGWYSVSGQSGKTNTKAPLIDGDGSFGFFETDNSQVVGHGVLSASSAVLGGLNPNIPVDSHYTVILGGIGIKARASDPSQVYVPNLNINTVPTNDDTLLSFLVRDPTTGLIKSRSYSSIAVGSSLTASTTLNFSSISSLGVQTLTMTVAGAVDGDVVILGIPNGSKTAGLIFTAWVSAADTVSIEAYNSTGSSIDPASGTFKVRVVK